MRIATRSYKILQVILFITIITFLFANNAGSIYATMKCKRAPSSTTACSAKNYGTSYQGCPSGAVCGVFEGQLDSRCQKISDSEYHCNCVCVERDKLQADPSIPPAESPTTFFSFDFEIPNPTRFESLEQVISALGALLQPIFIITFAAMIIYGAWVRMNSRGDDAKVALSSKIIIAAVIGFAIAVFAPTIVNIVSSILGVNAKLE
jgi:hypothetical protein